MMPTAFWRVALLNAFLFLIPRVLLAQGADQLYRSGVEALYNLEFETAERDFSELTKMDPQNPNRWNQLASAMWLRIVAKQEKLNLEGFSGASIGTEDSSDLINPVKRNSYATR